MNPKVDKAVKQVAGRRGYLTAARPSFSKRTRLKTMVPPPETARRVDEQVPPSVPPQVLTGLVEARDAAQLLAVLLHDLTYNRLYKKVDRRYLEAGKEIVDRLEALVEEVRDGRSDS